MIKNQQRLTKRYRESLEADKDALIDAAPELYELTGHTSFRPGLDNIMHCLRSNALRTFHDKPLPSHRLIRMLFEELPKTRKLSRVSAVAKRLIDIAVPGINYDNVVQTYTVNNLKVPGLTYCPDAEHYFNEVLGFTRRGGRKSQRRISVYYDPTSGKPVALRKSYEASSALLLEPVAVGDHMVLPQGMLVGLDKIYSTPRYHASVRGVELRAYPFTATQAMEVGRLSAWAYDDVAQRQYFAIQGVPYEGYSYDPERGRLLSASIDDFRVAAVRVMDLCGVEPIEAGQ